MIDYLTKPGALKPEQKKNAIMQSKQITSPKGSESKKVRDRKSSLAKMMSFDVSNVPLANNLSLGPEKEKIEAALQKAGTTIGKHKDSIKIQDEA